MNAQEAERLLAPVACTYGTNVRWLRVRTADYFGILDFSGKHVLDVGAGTGLYACALAALGASQVVALEPELKGSGNTPLETFRHRLSELNLRNIEVYPTSLQKFVAQPGSFDIISMLAVINHLDETHVQTLHVDEKSRYMYRRLLRPVFECLRPGGTLVISDSSRMHAFSPFVNLGILRGHPFQSNIEWKKHQPPKVWKALFEEIGFAPVCFHWATNWRYSWMPRFLVDNIVAAHFYISLFVLHAHRPF